jgi:hypothetical protein
MFYLTEIKGRTTILMPKIMNERFQFEHYVYTILAIALIAITFIFVKNIWSLKSEKAEPSTQVLNTLVQSCQATMLRDVCSIMKNKEPAHTQSKLYVVGVGEVDAQSYFKLKAAGSLMCKEVEIQCKLNWSGQSCKIARSLYETKTIQSANQI